MALKQKYTAAVIAELPRILDVVEGHFNAINRMMGQLALEQLGSDALLYRRSDGSLVTSREGSVISLRNLEYFLVVLFLTVAVVLPMTMLWNWRRD